MSHWNHRVVMHVDKSPSGDEIFYELNEVYYNSKGTPIGRAPVSVCGESVKDMLWTLKQLKIAIKNPPLVVKKTKKKNGRPGEKLLEVSSCPRHK